MSIFFLVGCERERGPVLPTNYKPIIDAITIGKTAVQINSSTTLKCISHDKDGDVLSIIWSSKRGSFINGNMGNEVKWRAPSSPGVDSIFVFVNDGKEISSASLVIKVGKVPKTPLLLFPEKNSTDLPLITQLKWKSFSDADSYDLQISTDESFKNIFSRKGEIIGTKLTIKGLQINNIYFWRVRGNNMFGKSKWSETFSFKTVAPPETPRLVFPIKNEKDVAINLKAVWLKLNNAEHYTLQVSKDSLISKLFFTKQEVKDTTIQIEGLEYFAKYYWRINAVNKYGISNWSPIESFITTGTAPSTPLAVFPQNKDVQIPLSFKLKWIPTINAAKYSLQISEDSSFNQLIVDKKNINKTEAGIEGLKNTQKYFWHVKAENIYGESNWSTTYTFTTMLSSPVSSMPMEGDEDVSPSPSFSWSHVDRAERYELQIAEDSSFTKIIYDEDNINSTTHDVSGLKTFTKYFWRVKAVNNIGFSEWSQKGKFKVSAYYYKGLTYGNQSIYNPLYIILNGGFDMIQIGNKRDLKDFPYNIALKNIWRNVSNPFGPINRYGWWNFLSDQVLPLSLDKKNGQFWPNYTLHLIGGGMDYAQLKEWYEYHHYPIPGWLSAFTIMSYHFINEVMENGSYVGDDVDPIADLYIFDIGGILLYTSESVKKFFSEKLNLADWSQQPSFSLRNGELHNNGQFFSIKWKLPFLDSWHAFYYFGTNGVGGLSYKFKDGTAISVGAGLAASDLILLDEKTNKKTLGLVGNFAVFYDKNNSLLASLSVTIKTDYMVNVNIYPGIIKIWGISPGIWGAYSQDGNYFAGFTFSWMPFGLANSVK